jgi:hypothetical protein
LEWNAAALMADVDLLLRYKLIPLDLKKAVACSPVFDNPAALDFYLA